MCRWYDRFPTKQACNWTSGGVATTVTLTKEISLRMHTSSKDVQAPGQNFHNWPEGFFGFQANEGSDAEQRVALLMATLSCIMDLSLLSNNPRKPYNIQPNNNAGRASGGERHPAPEGSLTLLNLQRRQLCCTGHRHHEARLACYHDLGALQPKR